MDGRRGMMGTLMGTPPSHGMQVLLLEAGENHDNDAVIANSADAWIGACSGVWVWE